MVNIIDNTVGHTHELGDKYKYIPNGSIWMLAYVGSHPRLELVCIEGDSAGKHWNTPSRVHPSEYGISDELLRQVVHDGTNFVPLKKRVVDIRIHITSLDELSELWGRLDLGANEKDVERAFGSLVTSANPRIQQTLWDAVDEVAEKYHLMRK